MRLVTKQEVIEQVPEAWERQYRDLSGWHDWVGEVSSEETYKRLAALGAEATEERIAAIIGNDTWTALYCDGCGQDVQALMAFDSLGDRDSQICLACLNEGVRQVTDHFIDLALGAR